MSRTVRTTLLAAAMCLPFIHQAQAQAQTQDILPITTSDLYVMCRLSSPEVEQLECAAYIMGASNMEYVMHAVTIEGKTPLCINIPHYVTVEDEIIAFKSWVRQTPKEGLSWVAPLGVLGSLAYKWSCK